MISSRKFFLLFFVITMISLFFSSFSMKMQSSNSIIWPEPQLFQSNQSAKIFKTSPCEINYIIQVVPTTSDVRTILNFYLQNVFGCPKNSTNNQVSMTIIVKNASFNLANTKSQEKYVINLNQNLKWSIVSDYYPGFVRGIETFSQLFIQNMQEQDMSKRYSVQGLPIYIEDQPQFQWRGLMIDTARHFLDLSTIKHQIDGLMYNKMNVLHWHIIDEQSFPYVIQQVPQLSKYGSISGTYSMNQINQIVFYALIRSIRVVPQIDTPAHTQSWGRSQKYKQIIVQCNPGRASGQFDPTLNLTYQVVKKVMIDALYQFSNISGYIHFGGDQTDGQCWDKKPSIKQWMKQNNITSYQELQIFYRKRQSKIYKTQLGGKMPSIIYWANQDIDLPVQDDDIIQWWGDSTTTTRLKGRKNRIILSNYDQAYLDVGFGDDQGSHYKQYITWRKVYQFQPRVKDVNIIGGQVAMWSQLVTKHVMDQKIWPRTCAFAQRLWNDKVNFDSNQVLVVKRLAEQSKRMKKRGFRQSPLTVQLCEKNVGICFPHK